MIQRRTFKHCPDIIILDVGERKKNHTQMKNKSKEYFLFLTAEKDFEHNYILLNIKMRIIFKIYASSII